MNRIAPYILVLILGLKSFSALGKSYEYPELMVSPSASERIRLEIERENDGKFFKNHKGLQISGMTTLVAGILQMGNTDISKDKEENSGKVGVIVGAGWLLTTTFLDMKYRPYSEGHNRVSKVKGSTTREKLTKERLAEEALNSAGRLGKRLDYIGFGTNFLASIYMMASAKKDTISTAANAVALVASITPLIFENYWSTTAKTQRSYKKKVFGPISFSPVLFDKSSKKYVSGAKFAFSF